MSGKSFLLPPAVSASLASADEKMASSAEKLAAGNWMTAQNDQSDAKGKVNAAAEMLLRSMDNMCNSSSASGSQQMMQQLQKMCQSQGRLNQQTRPLMGACQNPGGLSPSQQAAAQRLAEQQAALRKTLEELAQEFEQQANTLGKMDQTVNDMKKVEQDLRSFDITDRTLKNQERIMSRMLDAQKSLHKREFTEKRKSRTGEDVLRKSPNALPDDFGERKDVLQQSLLQILKNPYPRQYQEELRKYFQALGEDYAPASGKNTMPAETQQ